MAKRIKPEDLFDFDGYEQRIKELVKTNSEFSQASIEMYKRINEAQKPFVDNLNKYIDLVQKVNASNKNAVEILKAFENESEESVKTLSRQKRVQDLLKDSYDSSEKSISALKQGLADLKVTFEKLDPKQADFLEQQAKMAQRSKELKVAIDAQNAALKAASTTVKAAEGSYALLNKETNELRNRLKNMPDAFDKLTGSINKHNKEAVELQRQIQQNDKVLKNFDASIGNHQRNVGNYTSALGGLTRNVGTMGLAFIGLDSAYATIDKLFTTIVEFDRLDSALKNVTNSTQEFNQAQNFIERLASRNGQNIQVLTKSYMGLLAASRGTNLEGVQTQRIFTALTNAASALKLSNDDLEGALRAVQQMMSKGSIQSEELRGQLGERLYGAFNLAAKAIGVTTAQLGDMLKKGEVLASDLLPRFATELDKLYGDKAAENSKTISGSFEVMKTQLSLLIKSFNDSGAVTRFFSTVNNGLATMLEDLRLASKYDNFWAAINPLTGGAVRSVNRALESVNTFDKDLESFKAKDKKERELTLKAYDYKIKDLDAMLSDMYNKKVRADEKDIKRNEKYLTDLMKQKSVLLAEDKKISKSEIISPLTGSGDKSKKQLTEIELLEKAISDLNEVLENEVLLSIRSNEEASKDIKVQATLKELEAKKALLAQVKEEIALMQLRKKITAEVQPIATPSFRPFQVTGGSKSFGDRSQDMAFTGQQSGIVSRALTQLDAANSYKQILQIEKTAFLELDALKLKAETKGQKERLDLAKKELDQKIEWAKMEQKQKEEIQRQALSLGIDIANQSFDFLTELRQRELNDLQTQKDHELSIVGDNVEAKQAVEKKFAEEILNIKRKQARADKAQAAFNIGISTAQAIVGFLKNPGGIPGVALSVAAGVLGAIQLATVLARPLPQFFKGTDNAPEGLAWIAEKGPELRESNGKMMYYDKPQIAWLNQGDKIHTAEQTQKILAQTAVNQELSNQANQSRLLEIKLTQPQVQQNNEDLGRVIEKAFNALPIHSTSIDEDGFKRFTQSKNAKTIYTNSRYSLPK